MRYPMFDCNEATTKARRILWTAIDTWRKASGDGPVIRAADSVDAAAYQLALAYVAASDVQPPKVHPFAHVLIGIACGAELQLYLPSDIDMWVPIEHGQMLAILAHNGGRYQPSDFRVKP